jgi:hypothetical protein
MVLGNNVRLPRISLQRISTSEQQTNTDNSFMMTFGEFYECTVLDERGKYNNEVIIKLANNKHTDNF